MVDYPDWNAVSPEGIAAELPRLLETASSAVAAVEDETATGYESLVWALGNATRQLWRTWGILTHMTGVMNSEAWRQVEEGWQPKIVAFSLRVAQSPVLYRRAVAALATERARVPANPVRIRILRRMVEGAELAGVALEGAAKERFNAIQARLAQLGMDFSNAVIDATKAFAYEKDGKRWTIDDANYPETMKHCADREVRETLYRARSARAPENAARIAEILALRDEEAKLLGFASYAELSLRTKCAPSVAAVTALIDELDAATRLLAAKEEAELGDGVAPWDRAYLAERLRERRYAYSEEELKRHFELEDVLRGLWRMTNFLFGVDVVELTGPARPSVWHEDVRVFEVREDGKTVAGFYLDPYVRSGLKQGGAWMNEFSNRRRHGDDTALPLAVLVLNLPLPEDGRTLLPMREVETLFHEFGHALQCMLTRVDEEDAAGINLVEWDAVEVASQFMENWCLDDRTGIRVPAELKAKVRAAKNFRAATACRRQLAFANTDLRLHLSPPPADADAVKAEEFRRFGLPTVAGDRFLCAFTHIFAGGYAAGYYGYKWAEVMSADCYGAFEEAGLDDDAAMRRLGRAYRESVLACGGGESAYEVFRRFRGRAPSSVALLRQQGLLR